MLDWKELFHFVLDYVHALSSSTAFNTDESNPSKGSSFRSNLTTHVSLLSFRRHYLFSMSTMLDKIHHLQIQSHSILSKTSLPKADKVMDKFIL